MATTPLITQVSPARMCTPSSTRKSRSSLMSHRRFLLYTDVRLAGTAPGRRRERASQAGIHQFQWPNKARSAGPDHDQPEEGDGPTMREDEGRPPVHLLSLSWPSRHPIISRYLYIYVSTYSMPLSPC